MRSISRSDCTSQTAAVKLTATKIRTASVWRSIYRVMLVMACNYRSRPIADPRAKLARRRLQGQMPRGTLATPATRRRREENACNVERRKASRRDAAGIRPLCLAVFGPLCGERVARPALRHIAAVRLSEPSRAHAYPGEPPGLGGLAELLCHHLATAAKSGDGSHRPTARASDALGLGRQGVRAAYASGAGRGRGRATPGDFRRLVGVVPACLPVSL